MPKKSTEQALAKNRLIPQENELLGGWMPAEWWGEGAAKTRRRKRPEKVESQKPQITPEQIAAYRRRLNWIRLITCDDVKNDRLGWLPDGATFDPEAKLDGEKYFLGLCQAIFRERAVKQALGETFQGEDFISRIVRWWAQTPLTPGYLRGAVEGTSLDDGDED